MVTGAQTSKLIYLAAKLVIADLLKDRPKDIEELSVAELEFSRKRGCRLASNSLFCTNVTHFPIIFSSLGVKEIES
jgi:hypothetical protein